MSDSARPLGPLILMIVGVLLALAIFWIGFMLAPAAVLLISYVALSAGERGRQQQQTEASPLELPSGSGDEGELRVSTGQVTARRDRRAGDEHPVGNQPRGVRA